MELYGTLLLYLSLREIERAQTELTVKNITDTLRKKYNCTDSQLPSRVGRWLKKSVDQGITDRTVVHLNDPTNPLRHAYSYQLTAKYYELKKQYEL